MDKVGTQDLVVLLGTPTAESSELYATTMVDGDPSWAGALAGTALGLPVFHVTEDEVKNQADAGIYDDEVGVAEMVLELDEIQQAVRKVRESNGG